MSTKFDIEVTLVELINYNCLLLNSRKNTLKRESQNLIINKMGEKHFFACLSRLFTRR
jgi:hypothetical protein